MGKRRREQLNADAQKLQVQRLGELVDQKDALLLSDLPAQYQAAFDQPLRTESKLRKYLEGLAGFELCEGDKPGTHCLRRKSSPPPQKKARRAPAEVIDVDAPLVHRPANHVVIDVDAEPWTCSKCTYAHSEAEAGFLQCAACGAAKV